MTTRPVGKDALDGRLCAWAAILVMVAMVSRVAGVDSLARYVIYLLPPAMIFVAVVLSGGRPYLDRSSAGAAVLFGIVVALSLGVNGGMGQFAARDMLIIGGYLCLFSLSFSGSARFADILLLSLVAGMVLEALRDGVQLNVQLLESEGMLESTLAFPLGALFIYYVLTNRIARSIVTFIIFFVAFKRIALAAAIAALIVYLAIRLLRMVRWERSIAVVIMIVCSIVSLFSVAIFDHFGRQIDGFDATALSLGRFDMARAIWDAYSGTLPQMLFGHGPGEAHAVVQSALKTDPHNDWLKIYFEYGLFGLVTFYVIFAKVFFRNPVFTCIGIYVVILLMTDNTLIYMDLFAPLFLLSRVSGRPGSVPVTRASAPRLA